jgi:DNA polymerase-3 subunit epsilon
MFHAGYLSRTAPGVLARETTFAAVDVETTGLEPPADRVCEIAVVRFRGDGTVLEEYATLVDPQRDLSVDAAMCNHIDSGELDGAPTFAEIWPDVLRLLTGSVVVGHNLLFEDRFLAAELKRMRTPMPYLIGVCSMVTCQSLLAGRGYGLLNVYRSASGEWPSGSHTALGDSRALAYLVPWLTKNAPTSLRYYGPTPPTPAPPVRPQGRMFPRAERLTRRADGYLGALVKRFPRTGLDYRIDAGAARRYDEALDQIIEDLDITGVEAWRMERLAREAGFNQEQLATAHRAAWDRATADLAMDNPEELTPELRRKLVQLAHDLGYPELATDLHIDTDEPSVSPLYLRGWRIGVDGDTDAATELRALVTTNGGSIAKRLTNTVSFIAAANPTAETPQLVKARELGLSVIRLPEGAKRVRRALKDAAAEEEQRRREAERYEARRAREQAELDVYWQHHWRITEEPPEWRPPWDRNDDAVVVVYLPRR